MTDLQALGYDAWFRERADERRLATHDLARVLAVHRDRCVITRGTGDVAAEVAGNLLFAAESSFDLPATGDWVYADFFDEGSHAIIHGVLPRRTLLRRKAAGRSVEFQLIAANVDVAFIVQSLNEDFNLPRLERYLVMVHDGGIEPVILLSKADLAPVGLVEQIRASVQAVAPGVPVVAFSNLEADGLAAIRVLLAAARTYCLLGSSGVGKTTLLNALVGADTFETAAVSRKQSKGRHTTTSRQLVRLDDGAMIVDTPGMRELGSLAADEGLDETFAEIIELARGCRFADCTHDTEAGCAVQAAIVAGALPERRFANYRKVQRETAFHDLSYVEKRRRDKNFGKRIKSALKAKQR